VSSARDFDQLQSDIPDELDEGSLKESSAATYVRCIKTLFRDTWERRLRWPLFALGVLSSGVSIALNTLQLVQFQWSSNVLLAGGVSLIVVVSLVTVVGLEKDKARLVAALQTLSETKPAIEVQFRKELPMWVANERRYRIGVKNSRMSQ